MMIKTDDYIIHTNNYIIHTLLHSDQLVQKIKRLNYYLAFEIFNLVSAINVSTHLRPNHLYTTLRDFKAIEKFK
jgi:hypothetical protein